MTKCGQCSCASSTASERLSKEKHDERKAVIRYMLKEALETLTLASCRPKDQQSSFLTSALALEIMAGNLNAGLHRVGAV